MMFPAFLAAALSLSGQTSFTSQMTVSEPARLALTPILDGKLQAEEWDPLVSMDGLDSYFQWEPGKLHFAGKLPTGKDLLASLDMKGDGWLVGNDNLELRIQWQDGTPQVAARLLDASGASGPAWVDAAHFRAATTLGASSDGSTWTVEATVQDPGVALFPEKPGQSVRVRFDAIDPENALAEPFLPRETAATTLVFERGMNLPMGLAWKPEMDVRTVSPGNEAKIRLTFNSQSEQALKRIDMRTEGLVQDHTISTGSPFPGFDKKGRAYIDYKTQVSGEASLGYRVMRATLTDADDRASVLQTSFQVTPIVTFDFNRPRDLKASDEPQKAKFGVYIRSATKKSVNGLFRVVAPDGWKIEGGNDKMFKIYNPRGSKRQIFDVVIPGGFKGTAPLKLQAIFGGSTYEEMIWITVP